MFSYVAWKRYKESVATSCVHRVAKWSFGTLQCSFWHVTMARFESRPGWLPSSDAEGGINERTEARNSCEPKGTAAVDEDFSVIMSRAAQKVILSCLEGRDLLPAWTYFLCTSVLAVLLGKGYMWFQLEHRVWEDRQSLKYVQASGQAFHLYMQAAMHESKICNLKDTSMSIRNGRVF